MRSMTVPRVPEGKITHVEWLGCSLSSLLLRVKEGDGVVSGEAHELVTVSAWSAVCPQSLGRRAAVCGCVEEWPRLAYLSPQTQPDMVSVLEDACVVGDTVMERTFQERMNSPA